MGIEQKVLDRIFPAKLILFGEYSVLLGSEVLAIPHFTYSAKIVRSEDQNQTMNLSFYKFLLSRSFNFLDPSLLDQLFSGLFSYISNIPRGRGMGSSGALTAAVYQFANSDRIDDLDLLQGRLGDMESFFHGRSSGLDPLVALTNAMIYKDGSGQLRSYNKLGENNNLVNLYLYDSGVKRKAKNLVPLFLENIQRHPQLSDPLLKVTQGSITAFMRGSEREMSEAMRFLSAHQYAHMKPMILQELDPIWKRGLDSGDYFMKLCGSGGGGYYLIWTRSEEVVHRLKLSSVNSHNSDSSSGLETH